MLLDDVLARRYLRLTELHRQVVGQRPVANLIVGGRRGEAQVKSVRQRKAHLLARIKKNLVFVPIKQLPDGSYLAKLYPSPRHRDRDEEGIVVRIIDYTFDDPGRPGSGQSIVC